MATLSKKSKVIYLRNDTVIRSKDDCLDLVPGSRVSVSRDGFMTWRPPSGKSIIFDGRKQRGDGSQKEGQEPIMTIKAPLIIRGFTFRNGKDGIKFQKENWGLHMCKFINMGEDHVTSQAHHGLIRMCKFFGKKGADKCLQLNFADEVVVDNCIFKGPFITGVQFGLSKYAKKSHRSYISRCKFKNVETTVKSIKGTVYHSRCDHGGGKLTTDNGGRFKKSVSAA